MNKKIIQKLSMAFGAIVMLGFSHQAKAQGANTYQFSAVTGTYTNLATGTAFTAVQGDDICPAATVPLGFTFNFCGVDYTTVRAGSNGYLTFIPTGGQSAGNDVTGFPTIKPALFWLWDDIDGATGTATYTTTGTAPNQVFTFQFKNWEWNWSTTGPNISVQVKLYEGTNIIEYIYNQEAQPGAPLGSSGASIGIVDGAPTPTYLSLNNATATATASSTVFTTNIGTKPASGQIYRFKPVPPIDIKMDSVVMDAAFCSNAMAPVSVQVSNKGTALINDILINWTVDGLAQAPVSYSTPTPITNFTTAPNNTALIELGDVFFPDNTPRVIKAWVVQANSLPDAVNTNDTITASRAPSLVGVIVNIAPQDTMICEGTEITLDAGTHPKNPIYIWSTASLSQTIQVSEAGTFGVKVQNTDGCFDTDTITISTHPNPLVNSIAVIDNGEGSYTFNVIGAYNITSYLWTFGDGQTLPGTGSPSQVNHQYSIAGNYTVTLKLSNDCGDVVTSRIIPYAGMPTTGINDMNHVRNAFNVFPNPSKSVVTISNNADIKIQTVEVINLLGQQVFNKENIKASRVQFNIANLATGIYNIVIDTDKGKIVKKLEVIH